MNYSYYTSTEAAKITCCTRRQLQYWRERGVVVPTVNAMGKGRNVYYTEPDLVALTIMEYLLHVGLNFDICHQVLDLLRQSEGWLFEGALTLLYPKTEKRFMLLVGISKEGVLLEEFDIHKALKFLENGFPVIPFWCDRIHQGLLDGIKGGENRKKWYEYGIDVQDLLKSK